MRRTGFTIVELMIIVGIVVLLAALAITNLLRAKLNANEATSVSTLKTIGIAAVGYRGANPTYPSSLASMASPNSIPPFLDSVLGCVRQPCIKQGYEFSIDGSINAYSAIAVPHIAGTTGKRGFFIDESGVMRYTEDGSTPDSNSSVLE